MYFSLLTKWYTAVTLQALVSMCSVPFLKIRNRTGRPSVHPFGKVLWAFFASIAHQALSFAAPQGPWPCRALTTMLNGEVVPEKIKYLMCTNYILATHRIPMLCPSSWAKVHADSKSVVPISIMFICFPVWMSQAESKKAMPSLRPLPEFRYEWMLQIIYQDHITWDRCYSRLKIFVIWCGLFFCLQKWVISITCTEVRYWPLLPPILGVSNFVEPKIICSNDLVVMLCSANNGKMDFWTYQRHPWLCQLNDSANPTLHLSGTVIESCQKTVVVSQRYLQHHWLWETTNEFGISTSSWSPLIEKMPLF